MAKKADIRITTFTRREFKRARNKLVKLAGNLDKKTPDAVRMIGEDILTDVSSSRPGAGVPRDEGTLAGTGRCELVGKSAEISFGGSAAPYALVQHENTDYVHRLGEARYLIRGVERWEPGGVSAKRALAELQMEINKLALKR
jgi:hypothetical protein